MYGNSMPPNPPHHSDATILAAGDTSQDWESFEERVLLEPMPDSASSANGPAPASAEDPAPAEQPGERGPPGLAAQKRDELHRLVRSQMRHFYERGRPRWQQCQTEEDEILRYSEHAARVIKDALEPETEEDLNMWLEYLPRNPKLLTKFFKEELPPRGPLI